MAQSHVFAGVGGHYGNKDQKGAAGIFRRDAEATAWKHVLGSSGLHRIRASADPNLVFAGTADGVYRSTDRGATFRRSNFPDQGVQIWSFLVDPADPKRMLAGGSPVSIYRSEDGGESWKRMPNPRCRARQDAVRLPRDAVRAQHPPRPDEIFAVLEVSGVMRSTDGGETWSDCSADLLRLAEQEPRLRCKLVSDTEAEGMLDGHAICTSAADPDSVIIAVRMGLFRSRDKGKTWEDMRVDRFSPFTYGRDIKVSPQDPNTLYACLSVAASSKDGALYRSQDLGKTWQRFDKVQPHGTLMSVCLHHSDAKQVYIAARYGEVFGTQDGGETWRETPLPRACSTSTRWPADELGARRRWCDIRRWTRSRQHAQTRARRSGGLKSASRSSMPSWKAAASSRAASVCHGARRRSARGACVRRDSVRSAGDDRRRWRRRSAASSRWLEQRHGEGSGGADGRRRGRSARRADSADDRYLRVVGGPSHVCTEFGARLSRPKRCEFACESPHPSFLSLKYGSTLPVSLIVSGLP